MDEARSILRSEDGQEWHYVRCSECGYPVQLLTRRPPAPDERENYALADLMYFCLACQIGWPLRGEIVWPALFAKRKEID